MENNLKNTYQTLLSLRSWENYLQTPEIQETIQNIKKLIAQTIEEPTWIPKIISNLGALLSKQNNWLWKSQIVSLKAIIDYLLQWKTRWLIKLPTWAGKTKLFTDILTSLDLASLILVPNINLKWQTQDYLKWDHVFNLWTNGTVIQHTRAILKEIREKNIVNPIIIATYQSFIRLKKEDPSLFNELSNLIQIVIRDEAHRSLWENTIEALEDFVITKEAEKIQDDELLKIDLNNSQNKLELLLTATPNLLDKSVKDTYEQIIWLRLQDLIQEWVVLLPQFIHIQEAFVNIGHHNLWENILNEYVTKFVNKDWEYTYKELARTYIEMKKQNNNYCPWVWFCRNIEHAEMITQYLNTIWIRAIRVTSENETYDKWVDEKKAKEMLENNEVDIVVTVTKVSEWWDVPTLRCAVQFAPTLSEAKYIQWVGRVLRSFHYDKNKEIHEIHWVLPKNIACIIEPKFWNITSSQKWDDVGWWGVNGPNTWKDENVKINKISWITHFINSEEFDVWFLEAKYWNITEFNKKISQEEVITYFKDKWFDYWMSFLYTKIKEIEYKWEKIIALSTLSGWGNPNNVDITNLSWLQEFIAWVFEKEFKKEIPPTQKEVIQYFKEQWFDYWMSVKATQIKKIKYKWEWITALSTLSGWKNPNNVSINNPSWFQEFIAWVFEKEFKKEITPTQKEVIQYFKEQWFDYWMSVKQTQIHKIKYKWKNIRSLATLSGWKNPNKVNINTPSWFQEFIVWFFEKEFKKEIPPTQEEVIQYFKEQWFDYWMSVKQTQIRKIKYKWSKIKALAKLSGWTNPNNVKIYNLSWFQEFIAWVFANK
jgi:superfamily II DNA or RNA helicase